MACALTQGYTLDCKDSIGGLTSVYFAPWEDLATVTQAAGVVTTLTMDATKVFYKYDLVKESSNFAEAVNTNVANGTVFYTQTLEIILNKLQVNTRNEILLLAKNRLAVIAVDNQGDKWFLGVSYGLDFLVFFALAFLAVGFLAGFLAVDFLAVDFLAVGFFFFAPPLITESEAPISAIMCSILSKDSCASKSAPPFCFLDEFRLLLNAASARSIANNPAAVAKLSQPVGTNNSEADPRKLPPFLDLELELLELELLDFPPFCEEFILYFKQI
jgi:hypothetical protein